MKKVIYVRVEELLDQEICQLQGSIAELSEFDDKNINFGIIRSTAIPHLCEAFSEDIIVVLVPFYQNTLDIFKGNWESILYWILIICHKYKNLFIYTGNDWDDICYENNGRSVPFFIIEQFRKTNVDLSRLIWSMNNTYMMGIVKDMTSSFQSKPKVYYNNYYLQRFKRLKPEYKVCLQEHKNKSTHFLMPNRRPSHHRIALAAYLYKNHKDKTHLSFNNASAIPESNEMLEIPDVEVYYKYCISTYNDFDKLISVPELQEFMNQWPIRLDHDSNGNFPIELQDSLDTKFIYDSACHIVGETYFSPINSHMIDGIYYYHNMNGFSTEKSLKPFLWGLPSIWLSIPYNLKNLHSLGFKTFDGMIDETYDTIEDRHDRFTAIIKEIERISKIQDINGWYRQGKDIYEHNFNLLHSYINRNNLVLIRNYCENAFNGLNIVNLNNDSTKLNIDQRKNLSIN